jgi:hypothetical protein
MFFNTCNQQKFRPFKTEDIVLSICTAYVYIINHLMISHCGLSKKFTDANLHCQPLLLIVLQMNFFV